MMLSVKCVPSMYAGWEGRKKGRKEREGGRQDGRKQGMKGGREIKKGMMEEVDLALWPFYCCYLRS